MAHVKYTLKIVFAFILVLFIDSVNRLKTIDETLFQLGRDDNINSAAGAPVMDAQTDANYSARKFYAQRNMYLTGSTLFLTLKNDKDAATVATDKNNGPENSTDTEKSAQSSGNGESSDGLRKRQ
ncbi:B-cell receptor-associated protein 31-like-domain-containing protein [Phascolomyces articulosus]|uniref:Endoplasmic reticulum transmembrane protein n=1 Tax=Phascolomyces articulosus TaxID=60185 RepID=A0AAD5K5Z3_9FUNG|nr:B-cell receptor-associated protein 31-like-domain-containing protein [Phascolomyces articulosus]